MKQILIIMFLFISFSALAQGASNKEINRRVPLDNDSIVAQFSPQTKASISSIDKQLEELQKQYKILSDVKGVIQQTFLDTYCHENRIDRNKYATLKPTSDGLILKVR